jgi:vancomycin permeability regulator SanA
MARLKPFAILALALVTVAWLINQYIVVKSRGRIFTVEREIPNVEAVLVPGASVYRSGKLSPVLRQRMDAALLYLNTHPGVKLLVSGHAIPGGYNETQAMADFARRQNVPPENILIDDKGRSTYVSLLNVRRKFGFRRLLIVSQDYHLPRALYIAERMGMSAYGLVVTETPDSSFHLREYAGRVKDFFLLRVSKYFNAD